MEGDKRLSKMMDDGERRLEMVKDGKNGERW
jgi:hypothetical protein